ncbi:DUF488 domain-containing protein [Nocardia otitidiscaviarum]|uniref:DUF488 domain-containing protein n=1 Tax=Nocardia otitidiscaviarum TaxID=1823 RepID=A0A516NFE7_9NOCA|nr:DUF488 domain-containing protein [Nocardia otitidiscaviarum]MCP9622927.1 DUF488 domain-containing protein [Nocardia otitidiscaviarum]QDP77611.1 DUF488 domain-containing protein [Nocardia otitidiscaviarum]
MTTLRNPVDLQSPRTDAGRVPALVSVGYEGHSLESLVQRLLLEKVQILVDVRLNASSRKPGLSKTKLSESLRAAGIEYIHHRALGNPKDNRDGFRNGEPASRARFREALSTDAAADALSHVVELLDGGVVALLCYERDHATCHRAIVAEHLKAAAPDIEVFHL